VAVRTGAHTDYSRLVFDWNAATPYRVNRVSDDLVEITFDKAAELDMSGVNTAKTPAITKIEKSSETGGGMTIRVSIPASSTFRHFLIGNRVVLDVYGGQAKTQPQPAAAPKPAPAPVAEQPPVPALPIAKVEEEPAPPALIRQVSDQIQPHIINFSSTAALGLAVFERNGDVWIVADRTDITVPPQLSGPQIDRFGTMETIKLPRATAWRMAVPEGLKIHVEGGGLVWKILLTPEDHPSRTITPERIFEPGETIRGGTLFWPMQRVTGMTEIIDPVVGDMIMVATVDQANQSSGAARDFVDFEALNAPVGVAILPKIDDVVLQPVGNGVRLTRPSGLALTRVRDIAQKQITQQVEETTKPDPATPQAKRIFDFDRWMMGGIQALRENQQILLGNMSSKDKTGRVQDLLTLAKMNLANDRGQEAVGLLNFAQNELPEINDSPEYLALRGAAGALAGKFELAYSDLSAPSLKDYNELDAWRAYTLAGLEDWQQAAKAMPSDFSIVLSYPRNIQERLVLKLAEIALRAGDTKSAERLLSHMEKDRRFLRPWAVAGLDYLVGERARQAGQIQQAVDLWTPLSKGADDLYRARASLALTMLQLDNKTIKREEAIDRLEGLRYHWRGDELEAQTNFMLGRMYLEDGRYLKGFTILREATMMAVGPEIGREIATYMADSFKNLFLSKTLDDMTPIDAITVYEEFRELTPQGDEGNRLVQRLAERLVDADLLGRAATLLQYQVDYRLTGREVGDVGLRLAAIYLLNDEARKAISALDKAVGVYNAIEPKDSAITQKLKEADMLRARALSDLDRVEEALAILNRYPPTPEINRLRADIAWNAGLWEDAAEALNDLILDQAIDPARPLTQEQADLILNRAVALNLSGNRVALANLKTKYEAAMAKTARARLFDVVTRQRTGNLSSDRDSIAALVSEVDMFRDFLDSYRSGNNPSN
jgi:tetratricopeptide (TPR) repeat protein